MNGLVVLLSALALVGHVHGTAQQAPRPDRALVDCPGGCDDANPCTDDVCDPQLGCVHTNNTASCTDGNPCTTNDSCVAGACVGGDPGPGCGPCDAVATIPPGGGTFYGTTAGTSVLAGSCWGSGSAPERVFRWTPVSSGTTTIATCGPQTRYDTILYVRSDACDGPELACNDDGPCADGVDPVEASRVTLQVAAGRTYYIVVDGFPDKRGPFQLTVDSPSTCGNNVREGHEECDGTDSATCGTGSCNTACTCVPAGGALPDLVPEIVDWFEEFGATVAGGDVAEGCAERVSGDDLLRFGVRTRNLGTGDLFLGDPQCPSPCTDHPLEICGNPRFICSPAGGHNHAHYLDYARYELLDSSNQALVVGHKQGFCLLDGGDAGPCTNPKFTCAYQGITAGCADLYESTLGCQYLDVTDIPPGDYTLRVTVDPLDRIAETNENNNVVTVPVTLASNACGDVTAIPPTGGTYTGTTSGGSTLSGSCWGTGASPEKVFRWTPVQSGPATIETCSATATAYDTIVYVRAGACDGAEVACNDDGPCPTSGSSDQGSRIHVNVTTAPYFIVVDGYAGASGTFTLTVTPPPCGADGVSCDDGDPCTTGDACAAGTCTGSRLPPPPEVNDTLRATESSGTTTLAWEDSPGPFNAYRGSSPAGSPWVYNQTCLAGSIAGTSVTDAEAPAAGGMYWYLVTRKNACGESVPGRRSDQTPILAGVPCP